MITCLVKMYSKRLSAERGQILILTLIMVLLGTLLIIPLLSYMATGIKTSRVYEENTNQLYVSDSGIEDAKWQIKNDHLNTTFNDYDPYDFQTQYSYTISESAEIGENINGVPVEVIIENEWIPTFDYDEDVGDMADQEKLLVVSSVEGNECTLP